MAYRSIHVFSHRQEVEVTFDQDGFRGGWFRCQIRKIRNGNLGEEIRISYLDFPDSPKEWVTVRNGIPPTFMVRPLPPLVHEDDVDQYRANNVPRGGREEVYCYDYNYQLQEAVEIRVQNIFWTGTITHLNNRTGHVRISFLGYPGGDVRVLKNSKDLRPAMLWDRNPASQWTHGFTDDQPQPGMYCWLGIDVDNGNRRSIWNELDPQNEGPFIFFLRPTSLRKHGASTAGAMVNFDLAFLCLAGFQGYIVNVTHIGAWRALFFVMSLGQIVVTGLLAILRDNRPARQELRRLEIGCGESSIGVACASNHITTATACCVSISLTIASDEGVGLLIAANL